MTFLSSRRVAFDCGLVEIMIELLLGKSLLWILVTVIWREVDHQSGLLRHRDHRGDSLLLSPAKSGNSSWHHTTVGTDILRKNQDVCVFNVKSESAFGTETFSVLLTLDELFHKQWLVRRRNEIAFDGHRLLLLISMYFN